MKIYTKTGDRGTSSLYNGTRKCKNDLIFKFLGDFDELNCNLAMVKALHKDEMDSQEIKLYSAPGAGAMNYKHAPGIDSGKYYEWFVLKENIHSIQNKIMDISAFIATPPYGKVYGDMDTHLANWASKVGFDIENVNILEKYIDRFDSILPKLKNFVVPSGNKLVAQIHICRAITRRCERVFVELYSSEGTYGEYVGVYDIIDSQINTVRMYLNRLSDYFFMLSRFVAMTLNIEEDIYIKN
jgi:cob(I)alamin adenosyltransferase